MLVVLVLGGCVGKASDRSRNEHPAGTGSAAAAVVATTDIPSIVRSGLGRAIPAEGAQDQPLVDLIQTDPAISPGDSGGALVNGDAAVIGVNEAHIPPSAGAVSLGFGSPRRPALLNGSPLHPAAAAITPLG